MALKKNSPNISDEMSLLNEVPAFLKRETSPVNPRGAKDWIMFPNDMPLVSQILGSEPIMVQSVEAEEPLTITPDDIRTWLTGTLESGSIGFITGDVLYNELSKYVPKTTKVNGHALTGDITITKGDIGLGNVDNTSDMNKPISNAVNNKFQELEDTWGVDITQLKVDVNNIDQLLDKTVIEVNKLSEIISELDTDFTGHLTDQDAHSNIRVNGMVSTDTNAKIPNVTAVRDFVTNYVSRLPEFTNPAFNNRYFYILNGANQQKISDTELKNYFKMSTIYELVVTSPSQFPDPSTLTSGTIVRVGRFPGSIIIDPYTSYSAKEGEILVFNGNTYEHFAYSENVHNFTIQSGNDKLTLNLNDQAGTIGIDLPFVTNSTPGILSPADYETLISMNGLTKYGTPNSSWEIGYTTGDLIRLDKTSGGALDFIWNNPDNPKKTDADGNVVPYYAAVTLGDLTIKGNVTQEGSSFISKAETVEVKDNTLLLNKGETGAGVTKGTAGVEIDRGTLPRYKFIFDESDDRFKVGSEGDLWPVMIRDEEADLTDKGILTWDATTKRAKTAFNVDDLNTKYIPYTGNFGHDKYPVITGPLVFNSRSEVIIQSSDGTYNSNVLSASYSNKVIRLGDSSNRDSIDIEVYSPLGFRIYSDNHKKYGKIWTELYQGTGTGLDADLLDGQHGSYYAKADDLSKYLPLDGSIKMTGDLYTPKLFLTTKDPGDAYHVSINIQFPGGMSSLIWMDTSASNGVTRCITKISGFEAEFDYSSTNNNSKLYRVGRFGNSVHHRYEIYDEGNLDISTFALKTDLDNIDLSGYLPLSGGTMTSTLKFTPMGSVAFLNTDNSMRAHIGYGNLPTGRLGLILKASLKDDIIAFITPGDLFHQKGSGEYKIWTEGNDGSGSGLDADLLDGKQGSEYALASNLSGYLPLSGGRMTGNITINNSHPIYVEQEPTSNYTILAEWRPGGKQGASIGCHNTGGDGTGAIILVPFNASYDDAYTKKAGLYIGKNELLLDGKPVALKENIPSSLPANGGSSTYSTYLRVNDLRASAIAPTYGTNEIIGWFNNLGTPTTEWWSGIHVKGWSETYQAWQLAGPSADSNPSSDALYYKSGRNNTWNAWRRLAFANEIVTLDTAQTITGAKTFTSYTIFPAGSGTSSDIRLKENIVKIEDADSILSKLTGYRYTVKDTQKEYAGLIAQEVQKVLPEAVREDENGFLTVDTYPIVAALVEANNIKTQRIETLENRLFELEAKVNMLLSRI